jgi:hypothetical protein
LSLPSVLQVVFLGLKLGGAIDWRWIWILAPTWTSVLVIAAVWLAAIARKRCRGSPDLLASIRSAPGQLDTERNPDTGESRGDPLEDLIAPDDPGDE